LSPSRPITLPFSMLRRRPTSTLFPYTTLFRSVNHLVQGVDARAFIGQVVQDFGVVDYLRCNPKLPHQHLILELGVVRYDAGPQRSEEHTSELQSRENLVCRLLLEKKKNNRRKN